MENRKELSEKSKKLIAKQFKSDILNKSTGYYKKENIFPITAKPNELKIKLDKFIPHFNEIKPAERRFFNLLSDKQRNNSFILKHKNLEPNKNQELENERKRAKTIKDNCYDEKGNFSSKRRYILEFYGIDKLNKYKNNDNQINNIEVMKEEDLTNKQNIEKEKGNYKHQNNIKKRRIRDLILKSRNINNDNDDENENEYYSNIKPNHERLKTFNEQNDNFLLTFNDKNNKTAFLLNNKEEKHLNKISRNKNSILDYNLNLSSYANNQIQNTVSNIINPEKSHNRIRTDINFPNIYSYNIREIPKYHSRDISKLFYTTTNFPVKNIRIKKPENKEKEYFNLEFKNNKNNPDENSSKMDSKNIKEIFYKNGLHLYDLNEDGMNILNTEKRMEAKLRKNKDDINFEKNYKNALKILEINGIKVDKNQILNEKGFQNKVIKKKRKGTPGRVLYDNRFHKDENTKINTGKKNNKILKKKSKNIRPQNNNDYKNNYKYKEKYFNHNKK